MKWSGVKFSDFAAAHGPRARCKSRGWGSKLPTASYYVGLDRASAMHPQTLLAYEMNGQPLTNDHGAPLRLLIPVKYGVKNLKRIGKITFSDSRPQDYWAENGYDYDSGFYNVSRLIRSMTVRRFCSSNREGSACGHTSLPSTGLHPKFP